MNDQDPLLARLRDLPAPPLDPMVRDRSLAAGERALLGETAVAPVARAWSLLGLPLVLLATEGLYLVDVARLVARLFG